MKYYMTPLDVLSFRDGRPFGSGDEHLLKLAFPPSLSTIYGALRTSIMSEFKGAFYDAASIPAKTLEVTGDKDGFGELAIKDFGFILNRGTGERIYITPNDILKSKTTKGYQTAGPMELPAGVKTNLPEELKQISSAALKDFYESPDEFITENGLIKYLTNIPLNEDDFIKSEKFYQKECRTGITVDTGSKTVEQGALFTIEFVRINKDAGFMIDINHTLSGGYFKLGGEGRAVKIEKSGGKEFAVPNVKVNRGIKVVTITPLFSENGWYPQKESVKMIENKADTKLKFLTASIKGYKSIGGWDLAKGQSKPMLRYIPEGSVFYFEPEDKNIKEINNSEIINLSAASEQIKQGFGLSIIGGF
ncbi:MAG: type III-B CRISPR module-associated protein Cmr3 [Ignavibacteria bacterium]